MSYSTLLNGSKRIKDMLVIGVAGVIAVAGTNAMGLVEQCPEATVTFLGTTVGLKVIMDFILNWQKHKNDP